MSHLAVNMYKIFPQTTHVIDVELPSNSKKLCAFTILLNTFIHELHIQFRQAETILISKSLNLRPLFIEKPFAVVVDDKASPDFLAGLPQRLFPVNVRPMFLPETWYGYESVRTMILDAGLLNGLRERQFEALIQWIEQGRQPYYDWWNERWRFFRDNAPTVCCRFAF